jgi:branched-chain amino acid transport system ATP-binding protein
MSYALEVKAVSKHFDGVKAVEGVTFSVGSGALHGLIGPNGAGKTTLFNCITGETAPTKGEVVFEGTRISGRRPHELPAFGVSRSFQRTSIFPNLTVAQNVWVPAFRRHVGTRVEVMRPADAHADVRETVDETLDQVGLTRYANAPATALAHGDQRLLDFAIALAAQPRLLLLDEPAAGLSRADTQRVMRLIAGLKGRYTILLIEHKMDVVMRISDRITVMYFGKVLAEGAPDEIRANAKVREAYLGRRHA